MTTTSPASRQSFIPAIVLIATIALACAIVAAAVASRGYYWADDYAHLQLSRRALHEPWILLDVWGRPLMTAAYLPAAPLGDAAVRVTSLVLLFATAAVTGAYVARDGIGRLAAVPCLLGQPLAATLGYSALPGTVFSLVLATALLLHRRERIVAGALVASLLPAARLEGIVVLVPWAIVLARRHRPFVIPALGAGLALWAGIGFTHSGDPAWLLHANPNPILGSPHRTAGWTYILHAVPRSAGHVVATLALASLAWPPSAEGLHRGIALALLAFYGVAWGLPAFGTLADPVYLVSVSVPLALCASDAVQALATRTRPVPARLAAVTVAALVSILLTRHVDVALLGLVLGVLWLIPPGRAAAVVAAACLAVVVEGAWRIRPIPLAPDAAAALAALHAAPSPDAIAAWSHPALGWFAGRAQSNGLAGYASLPLGSIVAWDPKFGRKACGVSRRELAAAGYEPIWAAPQPRWARTELWRRTRTAG